MSEQELLVVFAVFDDISAADNGVDGYWDWSERITGSEPEAMGILVNQDRRLDAQLIGDDSAYGSMIGPALDLFEVLLAEAGDEEDAGYDGINVEQLISTLALDRRVLSNLRDDLRSGRALLLLILREEELESAREQLEALGGHTRLVTLPRAPLLQAAMALAGDDIDDDDWFDKNDDFYKDDFESNEYDDYEYDVYDDEYGGDEDSRARNGRYR